MLNMPSLTRWGSWLPALALLVVLLMLFRATAADMVEIWIRSPTFQHAFLVPPIAAWLVWRKRSLLGSVALRPVPWLLLPMAATCFAWLLGELADVAAATQFALVTLVVLAVPALFGLKLARLLAFPLLFLYFMVPFGDFAVPYLQEWTADVTVAALRMTGIPVYREGMQFVIPSGTWAVVEACSGIRYIIACFMVGTLFAHINYQSAKRRWAFLFAALVVPVFANWIRAYTIVMIGHLTGSPMILGVEHTTYGWFLFGVVVLLMFWLGGRWAETEVTEPAPLLPAGAAVFMPPQGRNNITVLAGVLCLAGATQAWAWKLNAGAPPPLPVVELPSGLNGWVADVESTGLAWTPGFVSPSATVTRDYRKGQTEVHVWLGYYLQRSGDHKLATSMHSVVGSDNAVWRSQATATRKPTQELPAFATGFASAGDIAALTDSRRQRTWYLYWLDGQWLIRPSEIKLRQAFARLFGDSSSGAIVMLVTPVKGDADAVLAEFAQQHLPALGAMLQNKTGNMPLKAR